MKITISKLTDKCTQVQENAKSNPKSQLYEVTISTSLKI